MLKSPEYGEYSHIQEILRFSVQYSVLRTNPTYDTDCYTEGETRAQRRQYIISAVALLNPVNSCDEHRIFHDIRGLQGAVECGLGSSTVRPPHRASCLYPLL